MVLFNMKTAHSLSIVCIFLAAVSVPVLAYEKKGTWEETWKANPVGGEQLIDGWYKIGPLRRSTPILWNNEFPPAKKVDLKGEYTYRGKKLKWERQPMRGDHLRINANSWSEHCAYAEFTWSKPERVIFRIHASNVRYIRINGKRVWEWDYISNREHYAITVDIQKKNRIFLQMSSHWHAYLRITYCSERVARERTELLIYLCEQFGKEHKRIINAVNEIRRYLDTYGDNLAPDFRKNTYGRIKAVLEKGLRKEVSPERISYYLDFCSRTGEQPLGAGTLSGLISQCPEKNRPGLLFKLAGLYITSFGSPGRGWNMFRDIMKDPETGLSRADSLYTFCNNHRYYIEGARILSFLVERAQKQERLAILSKMSALYRNAGETEKALDRYEEITGMKPGEEKKEGKNMLKGIRRAQHYISSIFRGINKENICILPQAIGLSNTVEFIEKMAKNGQDAKAYSSLIKEMGRFSSSVVDVGEETSFGTIRYIENSLQTWPESFRTYFDTEKGKKAASFVRDHGYTNRRALRRIYRMCISSPAAAELFRSYAFRLLQKGDVENAACWYERILQHHADPGTYLEYAYALFLSGEYGRAEQLRKSLDKKILAGAVLFKGKKTDLAGGLKALSQEFSVHREEARTGVPSVRGWTDIVSAADGLICRGNNTYHGYVRPPCVPAVSGNTLYVYTGVILRAYDMRTGKRRWSVRVRGGSRTLTETPVPVFRVLVSGDRVYVRVPGRSYSLNAYSSDSGRHVWSSSREPGLGGLHIASEPSLVNGMIVVTAARHHRWGRVITNTELFGAAVCPETGTLLWRHLLVTGESGYGNENISRHLPRALETDHGIFIQTNRKVFQMLDPLSGSIEWALSYRRSAEDSGRYNLYENITAAYGDSVVAAPRDSSYVYCVDIAGGSVRWTVSKGLSPVLCGIYRGKAVLLGRNLRLLDLDSGKEVRSIRIFRRNYFPLPFVSGDLLWLSYPSSTALFNLKTMQEVTPAPVQADIRMYPAYGCGIAEGGDSISVYGYTGSDFSSEAARAGKSGRLVRSGSNCVALRSSLKKRTDKFRNAKRTKHPGPAIKPVLWWVKRMDMKGYSGVRGGTELFVWSEGCVRLIETELFGETLWERRFDPSGFHVKHVQNVGDRVFVLGSRKISCLDLSSGKETWRISLPMYVNALHYKENKLFLYTHKSWSRSYRWRTGILNPEDGNIKDLAADTKYTRALLWDDERMLIVKSGDAVKTFDLKTRKTLWKLDMETRWLGYAYLFHNKADRKPFIYVRNGDERIVLNSRTGAFLYKQKEWELLPWLWQGYGEPYAYHRNGVIQYRWNSKKKKLEKKWHIGIKDLDDRKMRSYNIIGDNLAVFSHAGDHYMELTQLDRRTGKIKRRDELIRVSGGYHTLHSPRWSGNRIFALSDRILYCFRFPADKKGLDALNARRKDMLRVRYSGLDRIRSIRMYQRSSQGLRPRRDLYKKKLVLNSEDQWFPSDETDASQWKGAQDASVSVGGITPGYILRLQIDVTDDTWVPYTGDPCSGDRLILTTGRNTAHFGMNTRLEPVVRGIDSRYTGSTACRIIDSSTVRYTFEFRIHGHYFRESHHSRHSKVSHLSVGVGFADDDGEGVKGILAWPQPYEWGILRCGRR